MPLDPQIDAMLGQLAGVDSVDYREVTPQGLRQLMKMIATLDGPPEDVATVDDRILPGPAGGIPVRVYRPTGRREALPPILIWYHGGGWVIGDIDTADTTCRKLANRSGAVVVSVDYRLAPEHRAPAALDDCWAALRWVADNGAEVGGDSSRLAVGGDSAGGNLSALVALLARDAGGPAIRHQLLVYPATDLTMTHPSHTENGSGYMLTNEAMVWFVGLYLGAGADPGHPSLSPLHAEDLARVAPAQVITAEMDPLRDEGEAYVARLVDAGVPVDHRRYDGMVHGFFQMGAVTPVADSAVTDAAARLGAALA